MEPNHERFKKSRIFVGGPLSSVLMVFMEVDFDVLAFPQKVRKPLNFALHLYAKTVKLNSEMSTGIETES